MIYSYIFKKIIFENCLNTNNQTIHILDITNIFNQNNNLIVFSFLEETKKVRNL